MADILAVMSLLMCDRLAGAQRDIEVARETTTDRLTTISDGSMKAAAMFRQANIAIRLTEGVYYGELLTVYNTVSGNFWWLLRGGDLPVHNLAPADWFVSHVSVVQLDNRLVVFWGDFGALWAVERVNLHASSIDEAQSRTLEILKRRILEKGGGTQSLARQLWDGKEIRLGQPFPRNFWIPFGESMLRLGRTEVLSAQKTGLNWQIVMRNQWDQELILDESCAFVSTRRLDTVAPDQK